MLAEFACYLVVHFSLYVVVCRQRAAFQQERTIFCYHALPALGVTALCVLGVLADPSVDRCAEAAIIVGLQGIYSLSFLELWSLSQIGYSLAILACFQVAHDTGTQPDLGALERVGAAKKAGRIDGLQRLALVETHGALLRLTRRGHIVSAALLSVARLINLKRTV